MRAQLRLSAALIVVAFAAAPLSAQSWSALGAPANNGGQFWDNSSADGTYCNSGYVVTGAAGVTGTCSNQRPTGWLPYQGATPTTYLNDGSGGWAGFLGNSGSWSFSLLDGSGLLEGGDIAGQNTDWGYYDYNTNARTSLSSGLPANLLMPGLWGLYIQMTNGDYAYSELDSQFALFGFAPVGQQGTEWIVGMEDIYTGRGGGSDMDYNDVMWKLAYNPPGETEEVVPEPGTMLLLGTGLVGLAGKVRRRRSKV